MVVRGIGGSQKMKKYLVAAIYIPKAKKGKKKQNLRQIVHVLVVLSQNETGFTGRVNRFASDPCRIKFDWL